MARVSPVRSMGIGRQRMTRVSPVRSITVKKADGNFLNYRTFPLPLMENIPSGKAK
jgi:hypothetical protein